MVYFCIGEEHSRINSFNMYHWHSFTCIHQGLHDLSLAGLLRHEIKGGPKFRILTCIKINTLVKPLDDKTPTTFIRFAHKHQSHSYKPAAASRGLHRQMDLLVQWRIRHLPHRSVNSQTSITYIKINYILNHGFKSGTENHTDGTNGGVTREHASWVQLMAVKNACDFISPTPPAPNRQAGSKTNN